MLNLEAIIKENPFKEFYYWFVPVEEDLYQVYTNMRGTSEWKRISDMNTRDIRTYLIPDLTADFHRFEKRPEFLVGKKFPDCAGLEDLADNYKLYLAGVILQRMFLEKVEDIDEYVTKIQRCFEWLDSTDFFTAPASTVFHNATPSGLLIHSKNVLNCTIDLMKCNLFHEHVEMHSACLVALIHDWCKIGLYESYKRNVKNEATGQWEKVDSFRCKEDPFINLGHGVSSMFLAQKFFKLTIDECAAIRWHMGAWRVCDSEYNELQFCNEKYPSVHLIQFADQLAITDYI